MADLQALVKQLRSENSALRVQLSRLGAPPATLPREAEEGKAKKPPSTLSKILPTAKRFGFGKSLEADVAWPEPGADRFWEQPARISGAKQRKPAKHKRKPALPGGAVLDVVHITAEMAPIAKVGGLADVVTGLTKASCEQGHRVEIILPFYQFLDKPGVLENVSLLASFDVPKGSGVQRTETFSAECEGCSLLLLKPAGDSNLFKGERVYGGAYNETEAYLYFCRAALECLRVLSRKPDILHCHEWQCSAVPMLFWEVYASSFPQTRLVLTIHNFDSTGECRQDEFYSTGVPGHLFASADKALDERTVGHNPERLCLLKGGIVYANAVTTVSPNYALEAAAGGAAGFLKSTLAQPHIASKFSGVINGIDTEIWDPATDPFLPAPFSAAEPEGKALCKRYLQRGLRMREDPAVPLFVVISRLVPQKGIHLMEAAAHLIAHSGGQLAVLGTGHADGALRRVAEQYRDNPDVACMFLYSEALSHLLYAGADFILVPSLFEPCGLTQLIAFRYGTIPIVRATGGLADTVKPVSADKTEGTGYVFYGMDESSVRDSVQQAMNDFRGDRDAWQALVTRVLAGSEQWSWDAPAEQYSDIYRKALEG